MYSVPERLAIDRIVRQPNHRRRLDYVFVGSWDAHPNSSCSILGASLASLKPPGRLYNHSLRR